MSTGRKFADLNIETGKRELEDIPSVEALPRYGDDEVNPQIADGREATE
jgi:DNA recombination protein RmuC